MKEPSLFPIFPSIYIMTRATKTLRLPNIRVCFCVLVQRRFREQHLYLLQPVPSGPDCSKSCFDINDQELNPARQDRAEAYRLIDANAKFYLAIRIRTRHSLPFYRAIRQPKASTLNLAQAQRIFRSEKVVRSSSFAFLPMFTRLYIAPGTQAARTFFKYTCSSI
jgi:hypothetical protein